MTSEDCNKCIKADVCKYIEEKNKIKEKLKEIADNQDILHVSMYCIHFEKDPHYTIRQ